jgi:hypothetical protein
MASPVVSYEVDKNTVVRFEIEPTDEWHDVSANHVLGQIKDAVAPAVEGAKAVLEKAREATPDEVVVKFGIKVSGTTTWLVAKAATEGNFEVTLTWKPKPDDGG